MAKDKGVLRLRLQRDAGGDQGTPGRLTLPTGQTLHSLELPWRGNRKKKSRIPAGDYVCVWGRSPRFGERYEVMGVEGRSAVLIHSGNFAGDTDKGFKSHVEGCILLGRAAGKINGQRAVLVSKPAILDFHKALGGQSFILEVRDGNDSELFD